MILVFFISSFTTITPFTSSFECDCRFGVRAPWYYSSLYMVLNVFSSRTSASPVLLDMMIQYVYEQYNSISGVFTI